MEKVVRDLNIDDVMPNRFQPRLKFDEKALNELADSIKKLGVFQPIIVRRIGDKYEIIAGERRYKASVLAGKKDIPAIIVDMNDNTSSEIALLENVQRENLSPIEEAVSYKKILDMGYLTQQQLADKLGVAQPTIANKLRLLELTPEVQDALLDNQISERHARSLLRLKDDIDQVDMLERIVKERLTVRRTDEEINKVLLSDDRDDQLEILDLMSNKKEDNMENNNQNIFGSPTVETPNENRNAFAEPVSNQEVNALSNENQNIFVQPISNQEVSVTPSINPGFMDVAKIKEEATDINIEKPQADLDTLLKPSEFKIEIDPEEELKNEEPIKNGKFFNFNDNSEEVTEEQPKPMINLAEQLDNMQPIIEEPISPIEEIKPSEKIVSIEEIEKSSEPAFNPQNYNNYSFTGDEEIKLEQPVYNKPVIQQATLKEAIDILRDCSDKLSNLGFKVDLEEFDFDDMYQAIFKIDKK